MHFHHRAHPNFANPKILDHGCPNHSTSSSSFHASRHGDPSRSFTRARVEGCVGERCWTEEQWVSTRRLRGVSEADGSPCVVAFYASMAKTLASRTAVENADKAVQSKSSLQKDLDTSTYPNAWCSLWGCRVQHGVPSGEAVPRCQNIRAVRR